MTVNTASSAGGNRSATSSFATVTVLTVRNEVTEFLTQELSAHLADIKSLDPPPEKVVGTSTAGEFSWGTFMYALARFANTTGQSQLAGQDLAKVVGRIGLIEAKSGAKTFSQLYAALALRNFGTDLKTNRLWQGMTDEERAAWRDLLNPERFYDPRTNRVINLPENYFGVAARLASISYQLGVTNDRAPLDKLMDRAAIQFTSGALYSDDAIPTGRYDRYSNEYARYLWEAAEPIGRNDILQKLRPSLTRQMKLWWDVVTEDGYGYNWGRSQGVVSYLDTPEIAGFLGAHPEFRPAPLADIAALYYQAWRNLRQDYRNDRHLLSIFAFGRGNYSYITPQREWQQTTSLFGKLANSHSLLMDALDREGVKNFPMVPSLPPVARFEFFHEGQRAAGVWVVRQGRLHFALPITTGTKPGMSDYLPSPHGLPGFSAPVEQAYPALTPFFELDDGRTIVATDGADQIEPSSNGQTLRIRWKRWALVGAKPGELIEVGLTSDVMWRIEKNSLIREETLTADKPINIRHWRLAVPTSYSSVQTSNRNVRIDRFVSKDNSLDVQLQNASFPISTSVIATGDTALGRGVHGPIPLHLVFESQNLRGTPGHPLKFRLLLTVNTADSLEIKP